MNKIFVLGTGSAIVTKCFNTCFTLYNGEEHFLIDSGGGNGILVQLEKLNIDINIIHNIFVSHNHIDHLFGLFWLIRKTAQCITNNKYSGDLNIYCSSELANTINIIAKLTIHSKALSYIGNRIKINIVSDREKITILGNEFEFIDMQSKKDTQYGFICTFQDDRKLVFLGDEPYNNKLDNQIQNSDWLLTESFCLYSQRDIFKPYEKYHCTVKESSEVANRLSIKNLILWHTEDSNLKNRKELYTNESKLYYDGNIYVPNDLDIIEL